MGVTPSATVQNKYGSQYRVSNTYYPAIFPYERWGSINGSYTGSLGQSAQSDWYSGYQKGSQLWGKSSTYDYTLSDIKGETTVELALAMSQDIADLSSGNADYWLATRNAGFYDDQKGYFNMYYVHSKYLNSDCLYISNDDYSPRNHAIRPVVELNLASVTIGATGSGTSSSKYSISKR